MYYYYYYLLNLGLALLDSEHPRCPGHVVNLKKLFAYKKAPKNSLSSSSFSALLTISL